MRHKVCSTKYNYNRLSRKEILMEEVRSQLNFQRVVRITRRELFLIQNCHTM